MTPVAAEHRWRILHFSWIAFCCTFIAWFALAPVAALVQRDLALSNVQLGWLATAGVALTIPGRLIVGNLVDRVGPRKAFAILLASLAVPVALLGLCQTYTQLLVLRLFIGLVGCGFVIGVRLIADWFPGHQTGLAGGIYAGWGNAGSAVAALALPPIAVAFGWRVALACAAVPMLIWSVVFWFGVSDVPAGKVFRRTPRESSYSPWRDRRAMILAAAYFATFGSEVCLVHFLPKFFLEKFHVSLVHAGWLAAIFGLLNVVARPGGGYLADRLGRRRVLLCVLVCMAVGYLGLGLAPSLGLAVVALVVSASFANAGNGAVYSIVPLVVPTSTGKVAGIVGAAGNLGGLLFPLVFGYGLKWTGGSYFPGFVVLFLVGLAGAGAVMYLRVEGARDTTQSSAGSVGAEAQGRRVTMQSALGRGI
jgi:NNP family nitrate/nitrite transporter-like MFS transporter